MWEHKVGNRFMKSRALPLTSCHTDDVCTAVKEIASTNADEFCKCTTDTDSHKDGHGIDLSRPSGPTAEVVALAASIAHLSNHY